MYYIVYQVIEGKDIAGAGFQTFGYSINGGLDVDSNSYPDVLVGSLDDRVVLLRLVDSEVGYHKAGKYKKKIPRYTTCIGVAFWEGYLTIFSSVFLIRARPVIHLKKNFTVTPEVIDPNDCDFWYKS